MRSWHAAGFRFTKPEMARVRAGSRGKECTHVGVGVRQGDLPERPKGTFVLLMLGG